MLIAQYSLSQNKVAMTTTKNFIVDDLLIAS